MKKDETHFSKMINMKRQFFLYFFSAFIDNSDLLFKNWQDFLDTKYYNSYHYVISELNRASLQSNFAVIINIFMVK